MPAWHGRGKWIHRIHYLANLNISFRQFVNSISIFVFDENLKLASMAEASERERERGGENERERGAEKEINVFADSIIELSNMKRNRINGYRLAYRARAITYLL